MIAAARHFHATFLSGWWRWPREHFRTFVGRTPEALHAIRAPFGSYYADPFPWTHDGRPWLFVEEFLYSANRGRLVAVPLDEALQPAGRAVPLDLPTRAHASYPLLFSVAGETLLLPETGADRTVDLYSCERFPDRWRRRRRLLSDLDAVDTTPLHHADRWWLFTSVRARPADGGRRSLALFSSDDLFAGDWEPHPMNAARLHADSPYSFGRPAGPFVAAADGAWLRPMQASRRYYGETSQWMRVEELSRTAFRERPLVHPHPLAALSAHRSPHHVATHGGLVACDVRDRFRVG